MTTLNSSSIHPSIFISSISLTVCYYEEADGWKLFLPAAVTACRALYCPLTLQRRSFTPWYLGSSRVDCCDSLLYGSCAAHLRQLQSLLNGAARLIVGKRKYDHSTDTMRHDLAGCRSAGATTYPLQYKLCTLVSKCLRRTATSYLSDKCIPGSSTAGRQHLRSAAAAHHDLTIPRSRLARYGSRSFATSGLSLWNSLPSTIRDSTLTFAGFCSRLKTELYN